MNKKVRIIISFIISFIVAYLIVGYLIHGVFVGIKWDEAATIQDRLREYYIRTASFNIIPTLILAFISTSIIRMWKKS